MICIAINSLGRGGAERSILLLAEELVRRGQQLRIVCLFALRDEYPIPETLRKLVVRLNAPSMLPAFVSLYRYLRKQRPALVFSLMPQSNLASVLACRWLGLPVMTSERTTPTLFYRPRPKLALALLPHAISTRAVFISHYALDHGLPHNLLGRMVRRHASVLHNPVPSPVPLAAAQASRCERLRRLRAWAQAPEAGNTPALKLLLASRLVPGKGVLEFLHAASTLLQAGRVRVTIAGTGPLESPLHALAAEQPVAGSIQVLGFVDEVHAAYADTDVVVLSSESEGFGRVGFEAYQAGCLVLGPWHPSFGSEVIPDAPAWQVSKSLSPLSPALVALAGRAIPDDGSDIAAMQQALGIATHADRFTALLSEAMTHA